MRSARHYSTTPHFALTVDGQPWPIVSEASFPACYFDHKF